MLRGNLLSKASRLIALSLQLRRSTKNYDGLYKRKSVPTLANCYSGKEGDNFHGRLQLKAITLSSVGWNVQEIIRQSTVAEKKEEYLKARLMLYVALVRAFLSQNDADLISVYRAIASLAYDSGNYEKAEKMFRKLLEKLLSFGKTECDLNVIYVQWMLGKILEQKGEIQEATERYKSCAKLSEYQLESEREEAAVAVVEDNSLYYERILLMSWYSEMLMSQCRIAEAMKYSQEAYNLSLKVHGQEHESTMNSLSSLVTIGNKGDKYDQAIAYLSSITELGRVSSIGTSHLHTYAVLSACQDRSLYIRECFRKEEFEKAEQMLHVALRQAQSLQHQEAVTYIYDVMANLAFETGQHEKAEKLFVNVLQRIMSTGAKQDDLRVIHISLKLAKIFQQRGDTEKADHGYKFCMDRLKGQIKENPGNEDALALWAMTLDWYARLLLSQARLTDAYKYFQEAYDLCVKLNGEEHEQTVVLLNDLGTVSCMKGDHDKAIEHLGAAVEIGERLPAMADLGSIYVNLGNVYIKKGLYEEARRFCQDASIISKKRGNEESLREANTCMEEVEKLTSR